MHVGHALSADLHRYYPQRRRATTAEQEQIEKLSVTGAPARKIAESINLVRSTSDSGKGKITSKDIWNVLSKLKAEKRSGKTEAEVVEDVLSKLKERDPNAVVIKEFEERESADGLSEQVLVVLFIQTSTMQQNFAKFSEAVFFDGTYRLNVERYCL